MSSRSINAKNCFQMALKHHYSDEKVERCKQKLNDSLELDKTVYFESMKDFGIKIIYKFLRSIKGKDKKKPGKSHAKILVYALFLQSVRLLPSFFICVQNRQRTIEFFKRKCFSSKIFIRFFHLAMRNF